MGERDGEQGGAAAQGQGYRGQAHGAHEQEEQGLLGPPSARAQDRAQELDPAREHEVHGEDGEEQRAGGHEAPDPGHDGDGGGGEDHEGEHSACAHHRSQRHPAGEQHPARELLRARVRELGGDGGHAGQRGPRPPSLHAEADGEEEHGGQREGAAAQLGGKTDRAAARGRRRLPGPRAHPSLRRASHRSRWPRNSAIPSRPAPAVVAARAACITRPARQCLSRATSPSIHCRANW